MFKVGCLTTKGKGFKILKRFTTYEKAKVYFEKMKIEKPGQGYYLMEE
jgi:hypothetical protein